MGENFNENLRIAREQRGLTQKEVAEGVGVAKSTYSLYESGAREPNVQTIKKLADLLKTSADKLLGLDDTETIAAHKDGGNFTPEELEKIEEYKKLLLAARPKD